MARYFKREFKLNDGREVFLKNCAETDSHLFILFQQAIASESFGTNQRVGIHPSEKEIGAEWKSREFDPQVLRLGAFVKNKMIGQCNLAIQSQANSIIRHNARFGLMIIQEYWGSNLAKLMMQEMEFFALASGVKRIEAEVRANNLRAVNFYKKCGYLIEGTRKNAAFIKNSFEDEYYIAKLI